MIVLLFSTARSKVCLDKHMSQLLRMPGSVLSKVFNQLCSGGLMFGWNALALALKGQNIYSGGCDTERKGMQACLWAYIRSIFQHPPDTDCTY